MNHTEHGHPQDLTTERSAPRIAYVAPELRELGDIRDLTLGGSLGTGDSGSPRTQRR